MRERPILFGTPMVQAILSGNKTQTRRAIKGALQDAGCALYSQPSQQPGQSSALFFEGPTPESRSLASVNCPYGVPGDRLWVRESFLLDPSCDAQEWDTATIGYHSWADLRTPTLVPEALRTQENVLYKASWTSMQLRWQPSIFMPRWASRLTLEITSVRVERLHAISELDALAEGVTSLSPDWVDQRWPAYAAERDRVRAANAALEAQGQRMGHTRPPLGPTPRERVTVLWDDINGAGAWQANPWVWAVEFQVLPIEVQA